MVHTFKEICPETPLPRNRETHAELCVTAEAIAFYWKSTNMKRYVIN